MPTGGPGHRVSGLGPPHHLLTLTGGATSWPLTWRPGPDLGPRQTSPNQSRPASFLHPSAWQVGTSAHSWEVLSPKGGTSPGRVTDSKEQAGVSASSCVGIPQDLQRRTLPGSIRSAKRHPRRSTPCSSFNPKGNNYLDPVSVFPSGHCHPHWTFPQAGRFWHAGICSRARPFATIIFHNIVYCFIKANIKCLPFRVASVLILHNCSTVYFI